MASEEFLQLRKDFLKLSEDLAAAKKSFNFKPKRWHAAVLGFGLLLGGSSLIANALPITLIFCGVAILIAAAGNWVVENG